MRRIGKWRIEKTFLLSYTFFHCGEYYMYSGNIGTHLPNDLYISSDCRSGRGHVLLVEDDLEVAQAIVDALSRQGYRVRHVATGTEGLAEAARREYAMMIVDRALPGLDGLTMIEMLRRKNIPTPALVLSAFGDLESRVLGLAAGADDYLAKPFALVELSARVAALLRRSAMGRETVLRVGPLELDLIARVARKDGKAVALLPREFDLLEYLMRHPGEALSRTMLLERVWHYNFAAVTNVVDVYISKLRRKIEGPDGARLIQSVKGVGFMLTPVP